MALWQLKTSPERTTMMYYSQKNNNKTELPTTPSLVLFNLPPPHLMASLQAFAPGWSSASLGRLVSLPSEEQPIHRTTISLQGIKWKQRGEKTRRAATGDAVAYTTPGNHLCGLFRSIERIRATSGQCDVFMTSSMHC